MNTDQNLDAELANIEQISLSSSYDNEVLRFLVDVNEQYSPPEPEWEFYHGRLAGTVPNKIQDLEDYLRSDVESDIELGEDILFSLYFCLNKVHIQNDNGIELQRLEDEFSSRFEGNAMHEHILSQSYRARNGTGDEKTLQLAYNSTQEFNVHPGALNHLGIVIVERLEEGYLEIRNDSFPDNEEDILRFAESGLRDAIEYEAEYAIYHSTLGRILGYAGRYNVARSSIQKAIKLEKRDKRDSPIRISKYRQFLTTLDIKEQEKKFDDTRREIEKAQEEIQGFQAKTLEFLGFFAALLTVAVTSVTISTGFAFSSASRLILILIGGILVAFAGLGTILPRRGREDGDFSTFWVSVSGIGLIAIGFLSEPIVSAI